MAIPTKEELVCYDGLDEKCVVNHFLGRSADEVYEMFRSTGFLYAEDFMWMAATGLMYYLAPAFRYIESPESDGDWEFVTGVVNSLGFQIKHYGAGPELADLTRLVANYVRGNLGKFCAADEA